MADTPAQDVAAVVIGRNEGDRLKLCLQTLQGKVAQIIYVDSGSDDGSVEFAQSLGVDLVALDMSRAFTAARARNEGFGQIAQDGPIQFVQFIDGDCEIQPGWISSARDFLQAQPKIAVVTGRLRERHPDTSLWNQLADAEWDRPAGETDASGGIAMMRLSALRAADGFNPALIAGEEPELCLRLRRQGWKIWRLGDEMALHDIAMTRFSQWWKRTRRAGFAYAQGAAMYGADPERYRLRETRRALIWGGALPGLIFISALITPWALLLALVWPLQVLRLRKRGASWAGSFFTVLGKIPEALGIGEYHLRRRSKRRATLIEYK